MHPADSYEGLGHRLPPLGRVGQVSDVVDGILFLGIDPVHHRRDLCIIEAAQIAGR